MGGTPFTLALLIGGWITILTGLWLLSRLRSRKPPARRPRSQRPAAGTVAFEAGRAYTPRVAYVAGSARGYPVAPPAGGSDGGATAVFARVPAATSPGSRHRAGRDLAPLGSGRPVAARLERAPANAPRRAGVPGRAARGTRPGTPSEQTAVLHRVQDAPTETWARPAGLSAGRAKEINNI